MGRHDTVSEKKEKIFLLTQPTLRHPCDHEDSRLSRCLDENLGAHQQCMNLVTRPNFSRDLQCNLISSDNAKPGLRIFTPPTLLVLASPLGT